MALLYADKLKDLFPRAALAPAGDQPPSGAIIPEAAGQTGNLPSPKELFSAVVQEDWKSSGLKDLNAFTSCMVIRAAGFLVDSMIISSSEAAALQHNGRRLDEIIAAIGRNAPKRFGVVGYPPKTTMAYWFVDGITKANLVIDAASWNKIARWAAEVFYREVIYVASSNEPLMDPASLAMAACLINRIRTFLPTHVDLLRGLPSRAELLYAIHQVFTEQTDSGIWHKYFPLFHFPKGNGAADYCFSFEFLEAILIEFSDSDILADTELLEGIEKAVRWCDANRFELREGASTYRGWNSGGEKTNLAAGIPEAWATGAVHMFLARLESATSELLDKLILTRFALDRAGVAQSKERWENLINVTVEFPGEAATTLKDVVEEELIGKAVEANHRSLRKQPLRGPRSALLFGPPGTSKTTVAKAIAERLGRPLLVITPSEFLSNGLEQIYVRVDEIFKDLMDLSAAVILFDEMDALAQTRGNQALDVTRQLLTTSMLPKLADLWGQARVIFLMATNHEQQLDPAITRPRRFDLLLCVGPPTWGAKLDGLQQVLKDLPPSDLGDLASIHQRLRSLSDSTHTQKQLDMFTVDDLRSFLSHLRRKMGAKDLLGALEVIKKEQFENVVSEWAKATIALSSGSEQEKEYNRDRTACRRQ